VKAHLAHLAPLTLPTLPILDPTLPTLPTLVPPTIATPVQEMLSVLILLMSRILVTIPTANKVRPINVHLNVIPLKMAKILPTPQVLLPTLLSLKPKAIPFPLPPPTLFPSFN
jgi:hypothetical protein